MSGHQDHWKTDAKPRKLLLKIQSAHSRQADIEHDASGGNQRVSLQKFLRRAVGPGIYPDGVQQTGKSPTQRIVVIDDVHVGGSSGVRGMPRSSQQQGECS